MVENEEGDGSRSTDSHPTRKNKRDVRTENFALQTAINVCMYVHKGIKIAARKQRTNYT